MPGKSRLRIGVFIDWVYSEFQQKLLYGIMEYYKGLPADIFCFPTGTLECPDAWGRKKNILFDFVGDDNFDGLIILTDPLQCVVGRNKFSRFLKKYGNIPIVSIALRLDGHYSVEIDNRSGMMPLLDHLIIKHHFERIAFITGPEGSAEAADRLSAFMEYFKSHNLPVDPNLIVRGNFTAASGKQAVKTLLDERKVSFDCIFASDDEMAIGAIEELSSRGLRVPGDAFVAGFDDVSASLNASLTTVRQPIFEIGRKSSEILYSVLSGKKVESRTILPTSLVVRESCGCYLRQLQNSAVWKKGMEMKEDFNESFTKYSEKIINEIISGWPVEKYFELKSDLFPRLEALCSELAESVRASRITKIVETWSNLVFQCYSRKMDNAFINEIISGLRRSALRCRLDPGGMIFIEDILHWMRIKAQDIEHKELINREHLSVLNFGKFTAASVSLSDATTLDELIVVIHDILQKLEMKTFFLSLYVKPEDPVDSSMMILAVDNKKKVDLSGIRTVFKTRALLPGKVYPAEGNNRFIVQALHQKNEHIGFVILDLEDYIEKVTIYDELILKVSSTIRLIMLIDKISAQALSLQDEVKERKKAEKKLKSAMTKLEKYNEILHDMSLKDELTGLYNRRGLNTIGGQHINYARRHNKPFVLFYFDLDGLKIINDSYGHKEGDYAIKKTAQLLQKSFRAIDIIARIGGDEFTVLAMDCGMAEADKLNKRVKILFQNFNSLSEKVYKLSISTGIIPSIGRDDLDFGELIALADLKLYEDKNKKEL